VSKNVVVVDKDDPGGVTEQDSKALPFGTMNLNVILPRKTLPHICHLILMFERAVIN
jgi:hypothetical protein